MRRLTSIVARNCDGAIGAANRLPWRVKTDMLFFKQQTLENVVVMGRRTHQSLNGCLPKRTNIVLTHSFSLISGHQNCRAAGSINEALASAEAAAGKKRDVFVIGGATMYEQFSPFVDRYLITEISKSVPDADTFFDDDLIGDKSAWHIRMLEEGFADDAGNESDFRIFEYVAKDRAAIASRRRDAVDRFKRKATSRLFDSGELSRLALA